MPNIRKSRVWLWCLLAGLVFTTAGAVANECGRGFAAPPAQDFNQGRWTVHGDGTLSDAFTNLMWKQCAEGSDGAQCRQGRPATFNWPQAQARAAASTFAGHTDWRVPTGEELTSLLQPGCFMPALNLAWFPNTPSSWFWFQSPEADHTERAGQLSFAFGQMFSVNQRNPAHLRLVRDLPAPEQP